MDQTPKVIDIYHGNPTPDFRALKTAGIIGVIHKATQGAYYADPAYDERRKLAVDAGLLWGAYAFNTGQDPAVQVGSFLSHAKPDKHTLVCLDFEDNPNSNMTLGQAQTWLELCAAELGRKPVLYSGNRIKDLLMSHESEFFGSHRLWLAQYGPKPVVQASWQNAPRQPWLWQYTERGNIAGQYGYADLNAFGGTDEELIAEWAL